MVIAHAKSLPRSRPAPLHQGKAAPILAFPVEFPDRDGERTREVLPSGPRGAFGVHGRTAPPPRGFFSRPTPSIGFFTGRTGSLGLFARAPQASGFFHDRHPSRSPR